MGIEHFEWMDTAMTEVAEELASEAEFMADLDEALRTGEWPEDRWSDSSPVEEPDEDWDDPLAYNLDMGFDPYMGCYSDDC